MKRIYGTAISLILIAGFSSCGSLKMRPLSKTTDTYDCYGDPDNSRTIYAPIEEGLIHQGALKSKKINMESGIGMMEKTARLFILNKNEIRMVFHFMHPIDIEIRNFGFVVQGDAGNLVSGEMQVDYRTTIGGMTEEHAYIKIPADKMTQVVDDKHISIAIEDLLFDIPFKCRETFREIRSKNGKR